MKEVLCWKEFVYGTTQKLHLAIISMRVNILLASVLYLMRSSVHTCSVYAPNIISAGVMPWVKTMLLEGSLVKGNNDSYECNLYDVG